MPSFSEPALKSSVQPARVSSSNWRSVTTPAVAAAVTENCVVVAARVVVGRRHTARP